jgi:hypothetical protein
MSANSRAKLTIIVSGMIAGDPGHGGATWAVLQYLLGLRRLGHEVFLVEPVTAKELRPAGTRFADSENAAYFGQVVREFQLAGQAALLLGGTRETSGVAYDELRAVAQRTDVLINISGMLEDESLLDPIPRRAYLDLDPAFIQLWQSAYGIDMRFALHTHFVTIGIAIGTATCPVPDCGKAWIKTVQPIVLEEWPVATRIDTDAFTTVGNWRGYGSVEFQGQHYGQKAHSLRAYFELPRRTREKFALALGIHPEETKDLAALAENGWKILDPASVAGTPDDYRRFIRGSKAEFGIAKSGYVFSRCGWFSDRSVCYLASGRPVLAQETGFSRFVPTGEGLFAFSTIDDALAGIDAINADYPRHASAARALAEEYFDSDKVLNRLLEQIGAVS